MSTVIVIASEQMGVGDAELGVRLLRTFLQKVRSLKDLEACLFYNGGVKLVGPDSPVRGELTMLEELGVDLIPCGTCLQHFAIEPAVGQVGSMDAILAEIDRADKVVTL